MSLFKLSDSLFSVISIGRTFFFLCLPVYLVPKEVVWYCKIKRAGGAVISAKQEECLEHFPRTFA